MNTNIHISISWHRTISALELEERRACSDSRLQPVVLLPLRGIYWKMYGDVVLVACIIDHWSRIGLPPSGLLTRSAINKLKQRKRQGYEQK